MAGLRRPQASAGTTPVTAGYNTGIRPRPARPQPKPEPRLAPTPTLIQTLEVGVDREAAVGAAPVELGQHIELGQRETPLRSVAGVITQRVEPALQPAQLLVGQAGPLKRAAQDRADAVERHLVAEGLVAVHEALEAAGDPGAVVRADHRVLVLGRRVGREEHPGEPEEQVDELGVAGDPD